MVATKKLMSDGGLHHFHTPNALGMDNQALGYNSFRALAHGIFPPMHLQAFTPQNIGHFAMRSGYSIVQMDTPGNFDVDMVANWLPKDAMDSPLYTSTSCPGAPGYIPTMAESARCEQPHALHAQELMDGPAIVGDHQQGARLYPP